MGSSYIQLLTCFCIKLVQDNSPFQEIAILEFPTSDCFQNKAICDNKLTVAAGPVGNTWWRLERRNKLLVLTGMVDLRIIIALLFE